MITPGPENRKNIASRILELESRQPGLVKLRINPGVVPIFVDMLKREGFKKPFLQKPEQFVIDCALSYHRPMYLLLENTIFSGPDSGNGEFDIWYGNGEYAGWQGLFQLQDYNALAGNLVFIVINITSFISQMSDLLEPKHNRG